MSHQNNKPKNPASGWVHVLEIPGPTLADNTAFVERLRQELGRLVKTKISVDLSVIRSLPEILHAGSGPVRCTLFKHGDGQMLIDARANDDSPCIGLAVDLGTTRVVLGLVDMISGDMLGEKIFDNPQSEIGPDILARVHYAGTKDGLCHLQTLITRAITSQADGLARSCGISANDILNVSIAGNTAMTHFFLGADPYWMIREPYTPMVNKPGFFKSAELGLDFHPNARVFVFPNAGSYFGGDLVSGILYSGMHKAKDTVMLVDVGTNAEVVVGNKDWLMACAGAAGPALEGGVTAMGMVAGPGAIEEIRIDPVTHEFEFSTIGGEKPVGICGSGVIDLAAQLYLSKMIDIRGKFEPGACKNRLVKINGVASLKVVPAENSATGEDLLFTQVDLDSLVRSKAAMYTILRTITNTVGIAFKDLACFYVAGTFGSYIDPVSAITIGMIPDLPLSTYKVLGNTSFLGAVQFLLDREAVGQVDEIQQKITYMELNVNQEFMNRFSAARFIPHTDPSLFPSVVRS